MSSCFYMNINKHVDFFFITGNAHINKGVIVEKSTYSSAGCISLNSETAEQIKNKTHIIWMSQDIRVSSLQMTRLCLDYSPQLWVCAQAEGGNSCQMMLDKRPTSVWRPKKLEAQLRKWCLPLNTWVHISNNLTWTANTASISLRSPLTSVLFEEAEAGRNSLWLVCCG